MPAAPLPPLSILDLSPITEGGSIAEALAHSLDLARHADAWGYRRYWFAEHHNMDGVASSATSVLIAHVAAHTTRMRIGSGGVMLPNHAPLVIAEQFGTLATLHPGRIDLGIGRAPGTDRLTMRALRRHLPPADEEERFPRELAELMAYLDDGAADAPVRAIPGVGTRVPVWLLGSSLYSAQLAAALGLPFAFASHFAPAFLLPALEVYRAGYRPSADWPKPHAMVAVNVVLADSADEAAWLGSSLVQRFLGMIRGRRAPLPRPMDPAALDAMFTPAERQNLAHMLAATAIGDAAAVRAKLDAIVAATQADELIAAGAIHDHAARLRSYERLAALAGRGAVQPPT